MLILLCECVALLIGYWKARHDIYLVKTDDVFIIICTVYLPCKGKYTIETIENNFDIIM